MSISPTINVSILGESGCGKTSLLLTVSNEKPSLVHQTTLGSEFSTIELNLEKKGPNHLVAIQDFGGQREYLDHARTSSLLRSTDAILLCFDVNNSISFDSLSLFVELLKQKTLDRKIPIILVGLKNDLEWIISKSKIDEFVQKSGFQSFVWCSSKEFQNVHEPFRLALAYCLGKEYHVKEPNFKYQQVTIFEKIHTIKRKCPAEDCNQKVTIQISSDILQRAKESNSGLTEIAIKCRGKSKLGPHIARFFVDSNGDIRSDKSAIPISKKLSRTDKFSIILHFMIFKKNTPQKIDEKQEQKKIWDSILNKLDSLVLQELPKLKNKDINVDLIKEVYSLLQEKRIWQNLPITEVHDPRIDTIDIADFFFYYWLSYKKALKEPKFLALYNQLTGDFYN